MKLRVFILIWMISLPVFSAGNPPILKFNQINTGNGLPNNIVFSIYIDKDGFVWFGTDDGLARYDGYDIVSFQNIINSPSSISGNTIFDIDEDHHSNLWICTNEGVDIFDRNLRQFRHLAFRDADGEIDTTRACIDFFQDSQNHIFISTKNDVFLYDSTEKILNIVDIPHPLYDRFRSEYKEFGFIDSRNRIWMATQNFDLGLFCYDQTADSLISDPYMPDNFGIEGKPYSIAEQSDGHIWVGTNLGVYIFSPDLSEMRKIELGNAIVYSIFFDNAENAFIATEPQGLFLYSIKEKSLKQYLNDPKDKSSISSNSVLVSKMDKRGILWVGTTQSGVNYSNTSPTKKFENVLNMEGDDNSLSFNTVGAIFEDSKGNLWIGTDGGGLDHYEVATKRYSHFRAEPGKKNSLGSNSVLTLTEDSRGQIWAGGYLMGVNVIDKKTGKITVYKHEEDNPNSLSYDDVRDIYIDKDGIVWIATNGGGLNRFDPENQEFKSYRKETNDGIISSWCLSLFEDSKGFLWIGTYNGLSIFDKKSESFLNYSYSKLPGSLSNDWVYGIIEDSGGKIWIGTSKGLNYFDPDRRSFRSFYVGDGLPNNCINGLLLDEHENLWLSTNKGLSKFMVKENLFRNYDISDGLAGNQFFRSAYFKSESGKLYFGSYDGYTSFYPDSIKDESYFPPVFLTDLLIFHKVINPGDKDSPLKKSISEVDHIQLSYKHSVITLRYAALNFTNSGKIQYAYYLEGFSKNWDYVGSRREITFTNLDPGLYTFSLKASNADGVWKDEAGTSIRIEIIPPFWKTWLFRIMAFLLIVAAIFGFYLNRVRSVRLQNIRLEETVKKRTIEISEKNEELAEHRNNLETLVRDRTAKLEAALVKAREADELKSAFLANMSHEIRTPMNAIVGFSGLLNDSQIHPGERAKYIQIIQSNSEVLLKLIDEILDLSLIEANQLKITKKAFHLNGIIDHLFSYYYLNNHEPELEIRLNNSLQEQNIKLFTDSSRVKQIITNLLDNACKFTTKGFIELGCYQEGKDICIYVEDTGKGISGEDIKLIFERFRKAKDDTSYFSHGVGLGLAISQKIAHSLGGDLKVKSVPGKGSTFVLYIPIEQVCTEDEVNMDEFHKPLIANWKERTILIVEDEEANYLYLSKILTKTESTIIWAKNGEEAVKYVLENSSVDLILMDIKMPVKDGYAAAREIKKHHPGQVIIAQTAYARPEERMKFSDASFDDYIAKPIKPYNLLLILERYL